MHGTLDLAESARVAESARRECPLQGPILRERILRERALQDRARHCAVSLPLGHFDRGHPELFRSDTHWPYFDRLRKADPVQHTKESMFGPYWSVTKYRNIIGVESNHLAFSSAAPSAGITIRERSAECLKTLPRKDVFDSAKSRSIAPRSIAPGIN
jgi:hypothetical protein